MLKIRGNDLSMWTKTHMRKININIKSNPVLEMPIMLAVRIFQKPADLRKQQRIRLWYDQGRFKPPDSKGFLIS